MRIVDTGILELEAQAYWWSVDALKVRISLIDSHAISYFSFLVSVSAWLRSFSSAAQAPRATRLSTWCSLEAVAADRALR
jgi:hypothetical protein